MRYIKTYNEMVLENLAQARAILRKNDIPSDDERYLKIIEKTNKDGYTGLITRLVFVDGVDLDEALDLYKSLVENKVDVGSLSKKSYDDILDMIFTETDDSEIKFLFKTNGYDVFHVRTYEAGLSINSPSWCLKTKSYWDRYTSWGKNIVAIQSEFVKGNKTLLPTPNTFFEDSYRNTRRPDVRFGITLSSKGKSSTLRYEFFNDDNKTTTSKNEIIEKIVRKANSILYYESSIKTQSLNYRNVKQIFEEMFSPEYYETFDYHSYKLNKEHELEISNSLETKIGFELPGGKVEAMSLKDAMLLLKDDFLSDMDIKMNNGLYDIILYMVYGKESQPLSGMLLSEREDYDKAYRYTYGITKYKWGRLYILQSYNTIRDYFLDLIDNFHIFIIGDEDYGNVSSISFRNNKVEDYKEFFKKYYIWGESSNGFTVEFKIMDFYNENKDYFSKRDDFKSFLSCITDIFKDSPEYEGGDLMEIFFFYPKDENGIYIK